MKKDPLLNLLANGLLVAVAVTIGLCYWYLRSTRELRVLQAQAPRVAQARALMQSLLADLGEYRGHNPAIDPILASSGLKLSPNIPAKGGAK